MADLWRDHGVGFVDKVGGECLCGYAFSFGTGGWPAFNDHLSAARAPLTGLDEAARRLETALERTGAHIPTEAWDAWQAFRAALAAQEPGR